MILSGVFELPRDVPRFDVRLDLSGREYLLQVDYNGRADRWYVALRDVNGVTLASGAKIVTYWPLFLTHRFDARMPPGLLVPYSPFAPDTDPGPPGFSDLGRRVNLAYVLSDPATPPTYTPAPGV